MPKQRFSMGDGTRAFPRCLTSSSFTDRPPLERLSRTHALTLQVKIGTSFTRFIVEMELLDLPEECILHILEYLPVKGVIAFGETCQRMQALMPSNVLWLPRLREEYGVDLKVLRISLTFLESDLLKL